MDSEYKQSRCNGFFCRLQGSELFWFVCFLCVCTLIYFAIRQLFRFLHQRRLESHKKLEERDTLQTVSKLCLSTVNQVSDPHLKTIPATENVTDVKSDITITLNKETDFKTLLAMKLEEYIKRTQDKKRKLDESGIENEYEEKHYNNENGSKQYEGDFAVEMDNQADKEKENGEISERENNDNIENGIDTEMFYENKEGNETVRVISDLTSPVFKEKPDNVVIIYD